MKIAKQNSYHFPLQFRFQAIYYKNKRSKVSVENNKHVEMKWQAAKDDHHCPLCWSFLCCLFFWYFVRYIRYIDCCYITGPTPTNTQTHKTKPKKLENGSLTMIIKCLWINFIVTKIKKKKKYEEANTSGMVVGAIRCYAIFVRKSGKLTVTGS